MMDDVARFPHSCVPPFPHPGLVDQINAWCGHSCAGAWAMGNFYPGYGPTPPTWYFMERQDWVLFRLRWAQ